MPSDVGLSKDTLKALVFGLHHVGWAFDLDDLLYEVSRANFINIEKIRNELCMKWGYISEELIPQHVMKTGIFSVATSDFVWIHPKKMGRDIINFCMELDVDKERRKDLAKRVTEGFIFKHMLEEHSYPVGAFKFLMKCLVESLGLADVKSVSTSASYKEWTVTFKRKYIVNMPLLPKSRIKYYIIMEGVLKHQKRGVSILVYDDAMLSSDGKVIVSMVRSWIIPGLVEFLDAVHKKNALIKKMLLYILSSSKAEFNMRNKRIKLELDVPEEEFETSEDIVKYAVNEFLQLIYPCYVASTIFVTSPGVFSVTSEIVPATLCWSPLTHILQHLSMYTLEKDVFVFDLATVAVRNFFKHMYGVGVAEAMSLAKFLLLSS